MNNIQRILVENILLDSVQVLSEIENTEERNQVIKKYVNDFCKTYGIEEIEAINLVKQIMLERKRMREKEETEKKKDGFESLDLGSDSERRESRLTFFVEDAVVRAINVFKDLESVEERNGKIREFVVNFANEYNEPVERVLSILKKSKEISKTGIGSLEKIVLPQKKKEEGR